MSLYAPLRTVIIAAGLLVSAIIASSSAHALLLGDAVVRSAPGAPLRAVIPLKPSPDEPLETSCFRLLPAGGSDAMVTARVSLERAAATPRLVVTTAAAIADPVIRFTIEARCDGSIRRNYALVLDPSGAVAAGMRTTNGAREPGQEALEPAPAAADSAAGQTALDAPSATQHEDAKDAVAAPVGKGDHRKSVAASAVARSAPAPSEAQGARHVAAATVDSGDFSWYLGAPLGMGALALAFLFVTRRRSGPGVPDWTHGGEHSGPRSRTDMSAQPVTLSHRNDFTPMPTLSTRQRPDGASLGIMRSGIAANTLRRKSADDVSTLDTLINDVSEADLKEERAVREAWAAARNAVERQEDNEILRAIDQAERELLFVPPSHAEAAKDRSLEDDLLSLPGRSDKAAA
ncbi:MAG TPA: hypothetical protein VMN79_14640 [Casimicrobiaceae bacterium]|nr:hypothetical protein [Casimicrobiaceae bacterium]